jgi:hypothetical protein
MGFKSTIVHSRHRGYLVLIALVFGGIFFTIITAFTGFVVTQSTSQTAKINKEKALEIAEAGLDYYKWYLAHFPDDVTHGTTTPGPYVIPYEDPELGRIGEFALTIEGNQVCGDIASIDITSTGTLDAAPNVKRAVYGRYARPTVSEFAYIINSNVWAGSDRTIVGPYHSNGGIRMDGTNLSTVSSGVETWSCTSSFGCSPTQTQDGVFGGGPNSALWSWPSPPINFTGLSVDLAAMKTKAQSNGLYFAPSGNYGYHVVLQSNNTFNLYRVTNTENLWGYTTEAGWQYERHVITAETYIGNYAIPASCGLLFFEDKVWLEGTVNMKVTIAAANVITAGVSPSMILDNNIVYGTSTTAGLLAIAEQDVLVGLDVPDNMTLNGIFVAQNGRFGRNHYCQNDCSSASGNQGLPGTYDSYVLRTSLTVYGTIVSNGREGTKWTSGGVTTSGFQTRSNAYDRDLVSSPPPLTPHTSDTYRFIEWREVE